MLLTYIYRSITHRVHFLAETCLSAPNICSLEPPLARRHWGRCLQAQHSKAVARRLTAMPEVLPVQFMQMLCSNGVKLFLDLAVADECDSNHEQCCANNPQSEEPTSPIHCSANPRPS